MDFKVGDKVVMDRESSFYKELVKDGESSMNTWWNYLEEREPLVVEEVEQIYSFLQHVRLENTSYLVTNQWLKLADEK